MRQLETDVLIIGAGAAGMMAAIAACEAGARVLLADKSLIGRSGATVMAQMTVAAAIGDAEPDHWRHHFADTVTAGRGLVDEALAQALCAGAPEAIRRMDEWGIGWAGEAGASGGPGGPGGPKRLEQVHAPGHDRRRCVYVDFLDTGPAVSRTLRSRIARIEGLRRISDLNVTDLILDAAGAIVGALAWHLDSGETVAIAAGATIVAAGGLTRLYRRNSAAITMTGDGYALAYRAGASLIDMEFVQFFPIGHLAPRLVGMDPIMWDPFRYKLGGRLLNGDRRPFTEQYGTPEADAYVISRDQATYAITREVAAGRGSPHGGAWLSFEHLSDGELRAAFGPVIDRLAANGIDLTRQAIEVSPIAHYQMGGIRVDAAMRADRPGLFAAGEAVGGANGANRLSGNAITEALVFGRIAGTEAAKAAARHAVPGKAVVAAATPAIEALEAIPRGAGAARGPAALIAALQDIMQDHVGPFRDCAGLTRAIERIARIAGELAGTPVPAGDAGNVAMLGWLDARAMLCVADIVARCALARTESRGAHQREDFPTQNDAWQVNQVVRRGGDGPLLTRVPVRRLAPTEAA